MTSHSAKESITKHSYPRKDLVDGNREITDKLDASHNLQKKDRKAAVKKNSRALVDALGHGWLCGGHITTGHIFLHVNLCENDLSPSIFTPCIGNNCLHSRCDHCRRVRILNLGQEDLVEYIEGREVTGWFHTTCSMFHDGMASAKHCLACNPSAVLSFRYVYAMILP